MIDIAQMSYDELLTYAKDLSIRVDELENELEIEDTDSWITESYIDAREFGIKF